MQSLKIMGKNVLVFPDVYPPSEDSFILVDSAISRVYGRVLDLCCGTGFVGLCLAEKAESVTAVDLNPSAVKNTCENFRLNRQYDKLRAVVGDLFGPLRYKGYDLIVMNPPYLWDSDWEPDDLSWSGGERGRKIIDRFIREVGDYLNENGRALFVQSTLNGVDESLELIVGEGMKGRIINRINFMFEGLVVIEIEMRDQQPDFVKL
ncbi:MAG: methyltransferase [Candidatus Methanomethylicaceae archaeon]|nr:methyltransferase [Candidatus Verstraetearchaeota archaeon]